jgi:pimeloyl-ACP methyl ester carboxylesterase
VPVAYAAFPHEIFRPPRSWVEPHYAIARWTEMPRGGHFAALEAPELLLDDVRAFFRALR